MTMLQAASEPGPSSLVGQGLWAASALVFVCLLAALVLRVLAQRGYGVPGAREKGLGVGPLQVLSSRRLAPGQAVHLVRAQGRLLLVGTGAGAPRLLADLGAADSPEESDGQ